MSEQQHHGYRDDLTAERAARINPGPNVDHPAADAVDRDVAARINPAGLAAPETAELLARQARINPGGYSDDEFDSVRGQQERMNPGPQS